MGSLGHIEISEQDELDNKEDPPTPSPITEKSDMKRLENAFGAIRESEEQKESSQSDKEEKESDISPSHETFESSESEISADEAASIIEHSTISKATMKRLTLVRQPTLEDSALQSPTKLASMTRSNAKIQEEMKENIVENNKKRDVEIKKQYEDYMNLKSQEVKLSFP